MEEPEIDVGSNTGELFHLKRSLRAKKLKNVSNDFTSPSVKVIVKRKLESTFVKTKEKKETPKEVSHEKAVDDEEAWLEALEKGELDDNGEIPKAKDLSLLTARQKALLDRNYSSNLVEEITTLREEVTEEEKQKRIEKNKRRKLQAAKKAKETQKLTIKKLVEIPSKFVKEKTKPCTATNRNNLFEMIKYINRRDMVVMSYPHGFEYPLKPQTSHPTPNPRMCSVCGLQRRKYECAKTRQSLCSLHCYKQNLKNTEAT